MGGTCAGMLVYLVLTMVIFFTLLNTLNGMSAYKLQNEYDVLYNTYDEEFVDLFNFHFLGNCEDCGDLIFDKNSIYYTDEYEEDYYCDDCGFHEFTWDEWYECYVYANEYFPVEYRHSDFHFDGKMFNKYGEN